MPFVKEKRQYTVCNVQGGKSPCNKVLRWVQFDISKAKKEREILALRGN